MVTIPPGTVAGNYYILAVADADNTVAESNENNNVTARPLTISP
jgi:subtilase family serine protease